MTIGRKDRWWNRKMPVKKILISAGLVVVVVFGYICFESMIESVVWSVTHRSVATYKGWPGTKYEGFSVRAPWMWRQEELLGGEPGIELVRSRFGTPISSEIVRITRDASVGDGLKGMEKTRENLKRINPKPTVADFSIDADLATNFKCSAIRFTANSLPLVRCASKYGGRWSVFYHNFEDYQNFEERNAEDLNAVLRSLVSQR